jgi:glycosyltransferase involved in cell wall biosynthesis
VAEIGNMSIDFTVAIPTYNGASRLPKLLEKLRSQVNTEHLCWEIIVVDNNSTDDTAKVVQDYQSSWLESVPLKYFLNLNREQHLHDCEPFEKLKGN